MAAASGRMRILFVLEILRERTDKEHILNAQQIAKILESDYGCTSERKTIYADIDALTEYGFDICKTRGASFGYYLGEREFDQAELKLLVDAVQSSKFISQARTQELIRKLEKLTSREKARELNRSVYIHNRPKAENEEIFLVVDMLHQAINRNRQISFHYAQWTTKKTMELRYDGKTVIVSPWALTWEDENYYLVAYSPAADAIRHYRVDKIRDITLLEEKREGADLFERFDLPSFMKKTFGMFGGEERKVTLLCQNRFAGVILDRFGRQIMMIPADEAHFRVHLEVALSRQFFGWLAGLGPGVRIAAPEDVAVSYQEYLQEILQSYKEDADDTDL